MDHGKMQHGTVRVEAPMDHSKVKHGSQQAPMDYSKIQHGTMDHSKMQHGNAKHSSSVDDSKKQSTKRAQRAALEAQMEASRKQMETVSPSNSMKGQLGQEESKKAQYRSNMKVIKL